MQMNILNLSSIIRLLLQLFLTKPDTFCRSYHWLDWLTQANFW